MDLFWADFLRHAALHSSSGSVRALDGVEAAWVHSDLVINNGVYLTAPVLSEAELRARLSVAAADARPHLLPWAFYLYEPWVSALTSDQLAAAVASAGLVHAMGMEVMTGDALDLNPPARPLPKVEFRRIDSREDAAIAFDLNLISYGMPLSLTASVLDTGAYFSDPTREFGFLALSGGVPVSTATVVELDGWLYVALVATDPDHRQRGYAEAVMRHALAASASALSLSRTALDASAMGAPLYRQMGYRNTGAAWSMFVPA